MLSTNQSNITKIISKAKEGTNNSIVSQAGNVKQPTSLNKKVTTPNSNNARGNIYSPGAVIGNNHNNLTKQTSKILQKEGSKASLMQSQSKEKSKINLKETSASLEKSKILTKKKVDVGLLKKTSKYKITPELNTQRESAFLHYADNLNQVEEMKVESNRNNESSANTKCSSLNMQLQHGYNSKSGSLSWNDIKSGKLFDREVIIDKFSDCMATYEKEEIREFEQEIYYLGLLNRKIASHLSRDLVNESNYKERTRSNDNIRNDDKNNCPNLIEQSSFDDQNGNYVVVLGDHLIFRYEIISELGRGSYGQALKCMDHKTGEFFCIKIIKNQAKYVEQAEIEIKILEHIKEKDPEGEANIVKMIDTFTFRNHTCIVFELLENNLYELLRSFDWKGLDLSVIRKIAIQILFSLKFLNEERIIHCDLKPENILLYKNGKSRIKVIDFGSSCFENEKIWTYIQSRYYRAPEIILSLGYSNKIDMWSFGCIISELYTGRPLFPGENERDQLYRMIEFLGLPHRYLIERSKKKCNFFDEEFNLLKKPTSKGKIRQPNTKNIRSELYSADESYIDLILKCLEWDPEKRLSPDEALDHPWIVEGMPKELLNERKKEKMSNQEAHKEANTKPLIKNAPVKLIEINQFQKSNYLSFKSNINKNSKTSNGKGNLTAENKINSKFINAVKI